MFEFQLALRYLLPRKKSLSTALISIVSVSVISIVVWLVLVFLSVTSGIERNWLAKLTSLYAPLRISPTEHYYRSYFFQIDALAHASGHTLKTVGEKVATPLSDPYAAEVDMEIPPNWPTPDLDKTGKLKDPVKLLTQSLQAMDSKLLFEDFEIGGALLKLTLERPGKSSQLSQMSYLLSMQQNNPRLSELLLPPSQKDLERSQGTFLALKEGSKISMPLKEGSYHPILLPKSYRESGVLAGDVGFLGYAAFGSASSQEQRIPIRVAGFYDPGFLAIGNRCILVPASITRALYATMQTSSPDGTPTNGFFVWPRDTHFDSLSNLKQEIESRLKQAGIESYWKVTSFDEYEFSRDLLQQFRSDKLLFTLIAGIILLVACCNIISLLILLVNDKKKEIAILQAMGASKFSIGAIFALCGTVMGLLSGILGSLLAYGTLQQLDRLVSWLSALQGRNAFNPLFFGQTLPNELGDDALLFVLIATPLLSLLAGLIPAWKASRIQPSITLRME